MVTTEKARVRDIEGLVLRNKKSIIYKKIIEMGLFKFFRRFSRIYKKEERYKADKIGERADP